MGSIRGSVYDQDFDVPLAGVRVTAVEAQRTVETGSEGHYLIDGLPPGTYTLTFAKEDFVQQVKAGVVVTAGQLTDVDVSLAGDFTEMEPFVVQDVLLGAGTEAALLQMRFESPSLMDSISAELMSRAGASDAAAALTLVSGASVQEGKFAVVRGLPDRYVSSQMNGVRLPSADEDKRAVELDQFPAAVIESIQVAKTFTPDQQGDASGGAVDVRLKGIPDESSVQFRTQLAYNTNVTGESQYLTYDGGGLGFWGQGGDDPQLDKLGQSWDGAVGTTTGDAPIDFKWSLGAGGKHELGSGARLGGFASFFYEHDTSFHDDGINDSYEAAGGPGTPLTPEIVQGIAGDNDFKTALFDITESSEMVQWGGLATLGYETDDNYIGLNALYSLTAEDKATLAEDTRGKAYFFPGHDPEDPSSPGSGFTELQAAPYIRTETLEYTERTTGMVQLVGEHHLDLGDGVKAGPLAFERPQVDWSLSLAFADLDQPDKRQFGALWHPDSVNPGIPGFIDPFDIPSEYFQFKPGALSSLGNVQRIWKTIEEDSNQAALNVKWPFRQWQDEEGYLKLGAFADRVDREFDQDTFSNFGEDNASFLGDWFDDSWSEHFPFEDHAITASEQDVDYEGELDVTAWYAMTDMPVSRTLNVIGGARFETTDIGVVLFPEEDAKWLAPGDDAPADLEPGDADVDFSQHDVLPSLGLIYEPLEKVTLRAAYSQTVARQTFKELTPIQQMEFVGGPVFIGNPELEMSSLDNYDLRVDYEPYDGSLLSLSWFTKDVKNAIEYVQKVKTFTFTTADNYPSGELSGYELELRQQLGRFKPQLEGLSVGVNATFIESEVDLPPDEIQDFVDAGYNVTSRDMTAAPEHLYNLYLTYDIEGLGSQFGLFYTVQGDTLVAGGGAATGSFVPDIYATEYGTLNFSYAQKFGKGFTFVFQAKNLTDPEIEEVYRSDFTGPDVVHTSYTKGREFTVGVNYTP